MTPSHLTTLRARRRTGSIRLKITAPHKGGNLAKKPAFEKFRRYKVTEGDIPIVSVSLRGIFSLNRLAYEALGKPEAVEVLYAPEERVIGFQPAPRNSPDSYAVRHHTKTAHQVEGRSFMKYYEIPEDRKGRRYRAEVVDDSILTVDLNQDTEDV